MMDINNAARDLVDNVTLQPEVDNKITVAANHLQIAYNAGHAEAADQGAQIADKQATLAYRQGVQEGRINSAELWAVETVHKVTTFGDPVAFAIRYYHKVDGAMHEVLCSTEHAVLAELHVLLLKDDASGVSIVRVNRNT